MRGDAEERRQFGEYFAARRDAVRRTAYLLCGDWHWAEDLTQVAFIRLADGWSRVRDRQALDAFVRTCLVRAYLSETRRLWRRRERPYGDPPEAVVPDDGPEALAQRELFARALRRLPPRQRATLVCRYYQELDVAETAAALGCSVGTVKSQTARGLAALRELLGDELPGALSGVGGR
ncbi:SigE family RNA polymerase sigma factor [Rhizomonospora bruguierae]|uniref:SigE family RNA polymerase sigma factor n=1 Tax=Rhizomonospora bruguierae TaxID=1581705 RepID=UPI001BCE44DF|nr:SigE family RNA polymerase sigma factor [Micromonospora sp. NBRC 107566]